MPTSSILQPHSLDAEKTVLGATLLDSDAMAKLRSRLSHTDFYDPVYRAVYATCERLFDERTPIDFVTVSEALKNNDSIQSIGGLAFLADLPASVPTASHVIKYAQIVREHAQKRAMMRLGQEILAAASDAETGFPELLGDAQEKLLQLGQGAYEETAASLGLLSEQNYRRVCDIQDGKSDIEAQRFYTGYSAIDYLFEGFRPADLTIIAGRPGMGKTAIMLDMALRGADKYQKQVLFLSLEMANNSLAARLDANRLQVSVKELDRGELTADQMTRFASVAESSKGIGLTFDDGIETTTTSLRAKALQHKLQHGLDVLFIDYLQLIEPPRIKGMGYSNRGRADVKDLARRQEAGP